MSVVSYIESPITALAVGLIVAVFGPKLVGANWVLAVAGILFAWAAFKNERVALMPLSGRIAISIVIGVALTGLVYFLASQSKKHFVVTNDVPIHIGPGFANRQFRLASNEDVINVQVWLWSLTPPVQGLRLPVLLRDKDQNQVDNDHKFVLRNGLPKEIGIFGVNPSDHSKFYLYTLTDVLVRPIAALPQGQQYRAEVRITGDEAAIAIKKFGLSVDEKFTPILSVLDR